MNMVSIVTMAVPNHEATMPIVLMSRVSAIDAIEPNMANGRNEEITVVTVPKSSFNASVHDFIVCACFPSLPIEMPKSNAKNIGIVVPGVSYFYL